MNKTPADETFTIAEAYCNECDLVRAFIEDTVTPIAERAFEGNGSLENGTYQGSLIRIVGWLRSVANLRRPSDFQAIAAGARALFELSVDLLLMRLDSTTYSHNKLAAWEDSSKLVAAERVRDFLIGRPVPPEHQFAIDYITAERARILKDRQSLWPWLKGKHPQRWTGSGFERDVAKADALRGNTDLSYAYATTFASLCWNTHGSALAGVRTITEAGGNALCGQALGLIADFSVLSASLILELLGKFDAGMNAHFERLIATRSALHLAVVHGHAVAAD